MFDDQKQPPTGAAAPSNLPMGEPEDIFAGVDDAPPALDTPATQPSPAVPVTEQQAPSALSAGVLRPAGEPEPAPSIPAVAPQAQQDELNGLPGADLGLPAPPRPPADTGMPTAPAPQHEYKIKEPTTSRSILVVIIAIVVFVILIGGGFFLYRAVVTPEDGDTIDTLPEDTGDTPTVVIPPVETPGDVDGPTSPGSVDEQLLFGDPVDADDDGLEDAYEESIGTDPYNWDTDGDELSDRDEVHAWETDPLNPDTDGDSFGDGEEVINGYSPTGPGKIFEPPAEPAPADSTTTSDVTIEL